MNFYFQAARILDRIDAKQGSIKSIISTLPDRDRKRQTALVIETLKYKSVLREVIEKAMLVEKERNIKTINLALVLVHDLLLSRGIEAGDGPIKQAILRHKTRLHAEFQKIKIRRGAHSSKQLALGGDEKFAQVPRYLRVNTCLASLRNVIGSLTSRGLSLGDPFASKQCFSVDCHVPNLLLFHPGTSFQDDPLYLSGKIILQDKASCFPALVLSPPATDETVVIDATAAPGNKTSHLSALMGNKGKLFAFERDRRRFSTLKTMIAKAGCVNVTPINADFLAIDPLDLRFTPVTHILIDPSCSGSGIVNRMDYLVESEQDDFGGKRLDRLAGFQQKMIKHAMRFPSVKKIVYSTCSIHAIENEGVVQNILNSEECKLGRFQLAPLNEVLASWPRRGCPEELDSPGDACSLIRCLPGEDATNGFFVSCFVTSKVSSGTAKRKAANDSPGDTKKRRTRRRQEREIN